jgi:ATP-dependent DNA helicase PIF1
MYRIAGLPPLGGGGSVNASRRAAPPPTPATRPASAARPSLQKKLPQLFVPTHQPRLRPPPPPHRAATSYAAAASSSSSSVSSSPVSAAVSSSSAGRIILTKEQQCVADLVRSGHSLYFGGEPGHGKSYLLKYLWMTMPRETSFFSASTALAARHIHADALTVHLLTGVDIGDKPATYYYTVYLSGRNKTMCNFWDKAKLLVIDEISMLSLNVLDKIDRLGRLIFDRPDDPFGGLQVVTCGDFLQLGPIPPHGAATAPFVFQAKGWHESMKFHLRLTTNFRQRSDAKWRQILGEMRWASVSAASEKELRKCEGAFADDAGVTHLYATNPEVNRANELALSRLSGSAKVFVTEDEIRRADDVKTLDDLSKNVPTTLLLKVGALVLCTVNNNKKRGMRNGNAGIVEEFSSRGYPVIRWLDGSGSEEIAPWEWKVMDLVYRNEVRSSRKQLPLRLGWAITPHRAQGMTLGRIVVHTEKFFTFGQLYVAVSRTSSLANLRLNRVDMSKLFPIPDAVVKFESQVVSVTSWLAQQERKRKPVDEAPPSPDPIEPSAKRRKLDQRR